MPQHNAVTERMNRMLMEKVRSMLSGVTVTQELWEEVVNTTCYLVNMSLLMNLVNKTPCEAWDGKNPSLTHL